MQHLQTAEFQWGYKIICSCYEHCKYRDYGPLCCALSALRSASRRDYIGRRVVYACIRAHMHTTQTKHMRITEPKFTRASWRDRPTQFIDGVSLIASVFPFHRLIGRVLSEWVDAISCFRIQPIDRWINFRWRHRGSAGPDSVSATVRLIIH